MQPDRDVEPRLSGRDQVIAQYESRNLFTLALHHVVLRIAWIFKTESVIMPLFLDTISGQGWVRGCLPVLNRFGQSVPPLMLADRLRRSPHKKRNLFVTSCCMAVPFLVLTVLWLYISPTLGPNPPMWLPIVFLILYTIFFSCTGLNQLVFGTLQGKLIRPHRRGRLLGLSALFGSTIAVICAWVLLEGWLNRPDGGYALIFGWVGVGFLCAGSTSVWLVEPRDRSQAPPVSAGRQFAESWQLMRHDRQFRRVAIVAMLFISTQLLFPHYQALGRARLNAGGGDVMLWVVAQNFAAGVFSLIAGWIADRFGNRVTVRCEVFLAASTPIIALVLCLPSFRSAPSLYWITFALLGLTPLTMKTLVNYVLELTEPENHPKYVSTLSLCFAIPFVFSPLVGLLVDLLDFEPVFILIAICIFVGALLTFRMDEPRNVQPGATT